MKNENKGRCLRMCLKDRKTYWNKIRETKVQNEFPLARNRKAPGEGKQK